MTDTHSNQYQKVADEILDILVSSQVGAAGALYIMFSILYGFCRAANLDFEKTCRDCVAYMVRYKDNESDINYN